MRELPSAGRRVSDPDMEDRLLDLGVALYLTEKATAHIPDPATTDLEATPDA